MSNMDLNSAQSSDFTSQDEFAIDPRQLDSVRDQEETVWQNTNWATQYGQFYDFSDLQSAITMKIRWKMGRGYTCDPRTQVITDHVVGDGKQTFQQVLESVETCMEIGGDGYGEIIRASDANIPEFENDKTLINLKCLDPSRTRVVYNNSGMIIRYEQFSAYANKGVFNKIKNFLGMTKVTQTWKPEQIYHRRRQKIGDQIHGLSVPDGLSSTITKDAESFDDVAKVMHRQAKPLIMFKIGTDNTADIAAFIAKMDEATRKGENIYIPNDKNTVDYQVVEVQASPMLLQWRQEIRNRFYRFLGIPLVVFGNGGSTEAGGKMEYLAHQQVFEKDQKEIEDDIWNQIGLKIKLVSPVSLLNDLQNDANKDGAAQQLNIQSQDATAGQG